MGLGGLLGKAGGAVASSAATAAKAVGHEVVGDTSAIAGGMAQGLGLPTLDTLKSAMHGNPSAIAQTGLAAASVIPVTEGASRGLRALGVARDATALSGAERLGLAARTLFEGKPLFHGTSLEAAQSIAKEGFREPALASWAKQRGLGDLMGKADTTFVTPSVKVANAYASRFEKPAIVLARAAGANAVPEAGAPFAAKSLTPVSSLVESLRSLPSRSYAQVKMDAMRAAKMMGSESGMAKLGKGPSGGEAWKQPSFFPHLEQWIGKETGGPYGVHNPNMALVIRQGVKETQEDLSHMQPEKLTQFRSMMADRALKSGNSVDRAMLKLTNREIAQRAALKAAGVQAGQQVLSPIGGAVIYNTEGAMPDKLGIQMRAMLAESTHMGLPKSSHKLITHAMRMPRS